MKEKASKPDLSGLSRRERQIMDIIYRRGRASVAEVREEMTDPPSYSAVRALLGILEKKGGVRHVASGPRYVYFPVQAAETARRGALRHLMQTFFDDSTENVVAALLEMQGDQLSEHDFERLKRLIEKSSREGR